MSKEEIIQLIDELTERLEGPAAQLYELAVKSVVTGSILLLVGSLGVLIVSVWVVKQSYTRITAGQAAYKEAKTKNPSYYVSRMDYASDGWLMGGVAAGCAAIGSFVGILSAAHQLLNAGFVALRMIVPGL